MKIVEQNKWIEFIDVSKLELEIFSFSAIGTHQKTCSQWHRSKSHDTRCACYIQVFFSFSHTTSRYFNEMYPSIISIVVILTFYLLHIITLAKNYYIFGHRMRYKKDKRFLKIFLFKFFHLDFINSSIVYSIIYSIIRYIVIIFHYYNYKLSYIYIKLMLFSFQ